MPDQSMNGLGPTPPTPPQALLDPGNTLLAGEVYALNLGRAQNEQGWRLVLTIRTPSTTLTCFLEREAGLQWARAIRAAAQEITPLILPPGVG